MTKAQAIGEKAWQRTLTDGLTSFGWSWNHTYPLRTKHGWRTGTTERGWPDVMAVRGSWLLAIEVKGETTEIEPEQIEWLARFLLLRCARSWVLRPDEPTVDTFTDWIRRPGQAPLVHGWHPETLPPGPLRTEALRRLAAD